MPVARAPSIQRARRWAAPVHREDVPDLEVLVLALAVHRDLALAVLAQEQARRRLLPTQDAHNAPRRAAADVVSSSIRRPKKGR